MIFYYYYYCVCVYKYSNKWLLFCSSNDVVNTNIMTILCIVNVMQCDKWYSI